MKAIDTNFQTATTELNLLLKKKKPKSFNPEWIKKYSPNLYIAFCKNFRTGIDGFDWDLVTANLDPTFQKRWKRHENKITVVSYESKEELSIILTRYQDKLYTLMAPLDKEDRQIQDQLMIRLVRCAQKGNLLAKEHVVDCMTYIIYEWIESSRYMVRWKGYTNEIGNKIQDCIRNYRYSGSFMNYIFRCFQYSARGLKPSYSLDTPFRNSTKSRIDYVVQEDECLC